MQIKQSSRKKRNVFVAISIVVVGLIAVAIYLYFGGKILGWNPLTASDGNTDFKPATQEQINAGFEAKKESLNSSQENDKGIGTNTSSNDNSDPLAVTITAANQNNTSLQIRSLIDAVIGDGVCKVSMKSANGGVVTKTASVQPLSNSSTCAGFDIPTSELSRGDWQIVLTVSTNTRSGTATKSVTIE